MALFHCNCYSSVLDSSYTLNVILPQPKALPRPKAYPTLWLLHGLGDNVNDWIRNTNIERYALKRDIAVVMPDGGRSFYKNIPQGLPYGDFFQEELHDLARSFFPLSVKREDNFIAGASMGGYGAFRLALSKPERYAAAASLAGVFDFTQWFTSGDPMIENSPKAQEIYHLFSDVSQFDDSEYNLINLAKQQLARLHILPELYAYCGQQDFVYPYHQDFVTKIKQLSLPIVDENWDGDHSWNLFDQMIAKFIDALPIHTESR